jgi:O-acetyl-ADP-ribose deacetylase (regulator of RNase III)
MLREVQGNLLEADVEALVNTVNTVGIMGKGIALQFRQAFPEMYKAYEKACKAGELELGKVHVFDLGGLTSGTRWVINFPTKKHWRSKSKIKDIEAGLQDLVATIQRLGIKSIAIPPLGCGYGGLDWAEVYPLIKAAFAGLDDVDVQIFAPNGAPEAKAMPNKTERPKMTAGRASLVALMSRYLEGMLDPFVTLLEVHKLMYFMQEAGAPLRLKYEKKPFGPFAQNLRQVLILVDSHFIEGYGDGEDNPSKPLGVKTDAVEEAKAFLEADHDSQARMNRVSALIDGFETPYGMELLSTVHWVMKHEVQNTDDVQQVIAAVHQWNTRKKQTLKSDHIIAAFHRLNDYEWGKAKH